MRSYGESSRQQFVKNVGIRQTLLPCTLHLYHLIGHLQPVIQTPGLDISCRCVSKLLLIKPASILELQVNRGLENFSGITFIT